MRAVAEHFITEAEYLELEETASIKHEYFQGCIYAMSGGSNTHAVLCTNAAVTLVTRLRGKECRAVGSEQRVKIEATGLLTYPDASVYCPPARFEGRHDETLLNPTAIVEVLSPSTQTYDRTTKFDHYKQIASLTDYILIEQEHVRVEHYQRGEGDVWTVRIYNQRSRSVALTSLDLELPLEELYERLELPDGLSLLTDREADTDSNHQNGTQSD